MHSHLLPCRKCPVRFDFDGSDLSRQPMTVAAPLPILGGLYESARDRVAMKVAQLLRPLLLREDVEVVVAGLPERGGGFSASQAARDQLFQHLDGGAEMVCARLTYQQMDVFGHDDVAEDVESVPAPDLFQGAFEDSPWWIGIEESQAAVTTEGDEMIATELVVALETSGHGESVSPLVAGRCDVGRAKRFEAWTPSDPTLTPKEG